MNASDERRAAPSVSFLQGVRAALVLSRRERVTVLVAGLIFIAAALLPTYATGYWLSIGVSIAMFTVLATSWTLFSGPTNYIALSTAAFFGIGMYIVGGGLPYLPFPALVMVAGIVGALFAAVVGLATLRISGVYFVIFTLGLAELVRQVVSWLQVKLSNRMGLYVFTDFTEQHIYWMLLALTVVVFITGWLINR